MSGETVTMTWHRLDNLDKVPQEEPFLIWRAINEDGGFPVLARRVLVDGEATIRFRSADDKWIYLSADEHKNCRWAEIEPPAVVKRKIEAWKKRVEINEARRKARQQRKEKTA